MPEKIIVLDDEARRTRSIAGITVKVITFFAIVYTLLEVAALQFVVIDLWVFIDLVMILVFILGYMTIPFSAKDKDKMRKLDWFFLALGLAPCLYILIEMDRLQWTYGST